MTTSSPDAQAIETAKALLRQLETTENHPERLELELRIFLEKKELRLRHLQQTEASLRRIMCEAYKRHALQLLSQLRLQKAPSRKLTAQIEQALTAAELVPTDIGTTKDEIQKPERLHYRQEAEQELKWLKKSKRSAFYFSEDVQRLEQKLEKACCTLEDLGSSKEHLDTLRQDASKRNIIARLKDLKHPERIDDVTWWHSSLLTDLEKSGLSLKDVRCSAAKLERMVRDAHKAKAKALLQDFMTLDTDPDAHRAKLEKALERAGCTLEDLHSSDAEVQALMRDAWKRTHRRMAVGNLDKLRHVLFKDIDHEPQRLMEDLANYLQEAGCSLEELNSSDTEVQTLMRAAYGRYARSQAESLWYGWKEANLSNLRSALELTDRTLKDLGYSENGLAKRLRERRKHNRS